jgi:hypothetical protein
VAVAVGVGVTAVQPASVIPGGAKQIARPFVRIACCDEYWRKADDPFWMPTVAVAP